MLGCGKVSNILPVMFSTMHGLFLALVTGLFSVNLLNCFSTHCIILLFSIFCYLLREFFHRSTRPLQIVIPCLMIIVCMLCTWKFCILQDMANVQYFIDPQR